MWHYQFYPPMRHLGKFGAVFCMIALPWHAAFADATTEAQLRAALQQATTQIATLEDQVANLQAQQAPNAAMIKSLQVQLQTLTKNGAGAAESAADKAKNDAALAALKQQLAAQSATLDKTQSAYQQAASTASANASANTQLTAQLVALNAQIGSCNAKNADLFQLGNQILDAYARKDNVFGTLANHEPFIGFARVKLQNIVQHDRDKMLDDQIDQSQSNP
jgi:chromosome segregation ATPase